MPGPVVSLGCAVALTPGASGPPDMGVIVNIPQTVATANGLPLAVAGSICAMINSLSGIPYTIPIGSFGSTSVSVNGQPLVRMGDLIPSGPGVMMILGPPAAPFVIDTGAP